MLGSSTSSTVGATTAPENLPEGGAQLSPLLIDQDGQPIETLEKWKVAKTHLRRTWIDFLGPAVRDPDFALEHHQLLALIAPRPFLLLAGEGGKHAADGARSWPFIEAASRVYQLYGNTTRIGMYNHGQGHTLPSQAFEKMAEWLEAYV